MTQDDGDRTVSLDTWLERLRGQLPGGASLAISGAGSTDARIRGAPASRPQLVDPRQAASQGGRRRRTRRRGRRAAAPSPESGRARGALSDPAGRALRQTADQRP